MDVGRYFSTQSCVRLMVFVASCGGGVAIGGLWSLARFLGAAGWRRRKLQRALVIGGLLYCATRRSLSNARGSGLYFQTKLGDALVALYASSPDLPFCVTRLRLYTTGTAAA